MGLPARVSLLGVAVALFASASLRADFVTIPQPTAAYTSGTTLLDFTDSDYTLIGFISGGGQTLSYDNLLDERTVPASWSSWGSPPATETATPRVGYTDGSSELTITLSHPASTFGVEVEPDLNVPEPTTADFYSGTTLIGTISLTPDGSSGALLYAASTTTNPFTSVVITNLDDDDFAVARQRFTLAATSVPEPSAYAATGLSLFALIAFLRRRIRS